MAQEARLKGKMSMDDTQFHTALRRASAASAAFAGKVSKMLGGLATKGFLALTAAVAAMTFVFTKGIKSALDLGGSLTDLKARTGAAAGGLAIINQAMDDAGVGADKTGPSINKLQKQIAALGSGDKEVVASFNRIGVSFKDLKGLTPDKQFIKIGQAIAAIQDPAQRTAAAIGIFGKSGGELMQVFDDPQAFTNASLVLGSASDILTKRAGEFDEASDALNNIGKKFQYFFVGVADRVVGVINPILKAINSIDAAALGQKVGSALMNAGSKFLSVLGTASNVVAGAFQDPQGALAAYGMALKLAGLQAAQGLLKGLVVAGNALGKVISAYLPGIANYLSQKLSAAGSVLYNWMKVGATEVISILYTGFKYVAAFLTASFQSAGQQLLEVVGKMDKWNMTGLKGYKAASFSENFDNSFKVMDENPLAQKIKAAKADADTQLENSLVSLADAGAGIMESIEQAMPRILDGTALDSSVNKAKTDLNNAIGQLAVKGKPAIQNIINKAVTSINGMVNPSAQKQVLPYRKQSEFSKAQAGPSRWQQLQDKASAFEELQKPRDSVMSEPSRKVNGVRRRGETKEEFKARMEATSSKEKDAAQSQQAVADNTDILATIIKQWDKAAT